MRRSLPAKALLRGAEAMSLAEGMAETRARFLLLLKHDAAALAAMRLLSLVGAAAAGLAAAEMKNGRIDCSDHTVAVLPAAPSVPSIAAYTRTRGAAEASTS